MSKPPDLLGGRGIYLNQRQEANMPGSSRRPETPAVKIVGGGIGGLYAAYLLGKHSYSVELFEQGPEFGGRIESKRAGPFIAEFGPMRFEPDLQDSLRRLAFHLGLGFTFFAPTHAPVSPTHHDITDREDTFRDPVDLLEWAILKMFFQFEIPALSNLDGPRQLARLKLHMERQLFLDVGGNRVRRYSPTSIQSKLDDLRRQARLRGRYKIGRDGKHSANDAPLLASLGIWNGLAAVVTPGALARIRETGTFYHFIPYNVSALEWGIFWLRQTSLLGGVYRFDPSGAINGVHTLVELLVDAIRRECPTVRLVREQRVRRVEHGKRPDEVVLRVEHLGDRGAHPSFSVRADHVVLAIPQFPLKALSEHFPDDIQSRIGEVFPLPMLKAFLVTTRPWWDFHTPAQTYAWMVPTRELHYYRPEHIDCRHLQGDREGECLCSKMKDANHGMVMLYTDAPAISYWQPLIPGAVQPEPFECARDAPGEPLERTMLLDALVAQLLDAAHPRIAKKIDDAREQILAELEEELSQPHAELLDELVELLKVANQDIRGKGSSDRDRILDKVERHTQLHALMRQLRNRKSLARAFLSLAAVDDPTTVKGEVKKAVEDVLGYRFGESTTLWLDQLQKEMTRTKWSTEDSWRYVTWYGAHDWSRPPFGGASHVWLPGSTLLGRTLESSSQKGADSLAEGPSLIAFGLRGRDGADYGKNVHICGEAFSGFQGFIEGALRTAEKVVESILGAAVDFESMFPRTGTRLGDLERQWERKRQRRLAKGWAKLEGAADASASRTA
jgi:vacuolar-type H+-ATPase subunit H